VNRDAIAIGQPHRCGVLQNPARIGIGRLVKGHVVPEERLIGAPGVLRDRVAVGIVLRDGALPKTGGQPVQQQFGPILPVLDVVVTDGESQKTEASGNLLHELGEIVAAPGGLDSIEEV
jgi:hypothetical protein